MDYKMRRKYTNSIFIKPERHSMLTDFCFKLTTITQVDVDTASIYGDAIDHINEDVLNNVGWNIRDLIMVSWGDYDRDMFIQCGRFWGLQSPYPFRAHINLKREFAIANRLKSKGMGLQKALELKDMIFEGTPHRAFSDALNVAKLMALQWPYGYDGWAQFIVNKPNIM
jgi:inhibitor of KinA sporulation pathway (predicted exonuclease)